jgi:hypothetical protein
MYSLSPHSPQFQLSAGASKPSLVSLDCRRWADSTEKGKEVLFTLYLFFAMNGWLFYVDTLHYEVHRVPLHPYRSTQTNLPFSPKFQLKLTYTEKLPYE